jgi:hypothetical protein
VNDQPRNGLAAVDGTTGALLPWDPNPSGPREDALYTSIHALATQGNTVFVGGDFTRIGGKAHAGLAALHGVTGTALDWDPNPDQSVWALDASSDRFFAGGFFQAAKWTPHLAVMDVSYPEVLGEPPLFPRVATLEPVAPNPMRSSAVIRYSVPIATSVSLVVYDPQGRRVATLMDRVFQDAGRHEMPIQASHWKPGVYFYRLEAGGASATRKMVVVK